MNLANLKETLPKDLLASVVVFLVALPLCMGIAIASGMPPAAGLVTGIIGGIIVGFFAGSPLQVSGPAAGLAVIVWEIVRDHGVSALGPILMIAGLLQVAAGFAKVGQWFRAISPAVVYGMLAGIGILIFASQFHAMVDDKPRGNGLENLLSIPGAIMKGIFPRGRQRASHRGRAGRSDHRDYHPLEQVPPGCAEIRSPVRSWRSPPPPSLRL
jgi:MFS superfamily sulfate permease-like transporter